MLVTSIDRFIECIPTAIDTEYKIIQTYLESADIEMNYNIFGSGLMTAIQGLQVESSVIRNIADKIHCLIGYKNAIPFCDLIQTNTGFAVVSNNNMAPASKERVERLLMWCDNQSDSLLDVITDLIRSDDTLLAKWVEFPKYNDIFNTLFISGADFLRFASPENPGVLNPRKLFLQAKPKIIEQQSKLHKVVSKSYMNELIKKVSANTLTDDDKLVVDLCKKVIGSTFSNNHMEVRDVVDELYLLLTENIDKYATFANSSEYLSQGVNYENKQTDSTYFFGL